MATQKNTQLQPFQQSSNLIGIAGLSYLLLGCERSILELWTPGTVQAAELQAPAPAIPQKQTYPDRPLIPPGSGAVLARADDDAEAPPPRNPFQWSTPCRAANDSGGLVILTGNMCKERRVRLAAANADGVLEAPEASKLHSLAKR